MRRAVLSIVPERDVANVCFWPHKRTFDSPDIRYSGSLAGRVIQCNAAFENTASNCAKYGNA